MKNAIILIIGLLLLNCGNANSNEKVKEKLLIEGSTNIYCTPDLYNLTTIWADEFCSLNPNLQINVIKVTESSVAKVLNVDRSLSFISNEYYSALKSEPIWQIKVGRDIIVPIINSKNPFMDEIYNQGISSEKFAQIFKNPEILMWSTLLKNGKNVPINFYMVDDESINSAIVNFSK
ncbi:substrate-binding domain-containing protein, partial [Bacteroidota bacterium]